MGARGAANHSLLAFLLVSAVLTTGARAAHAQEIRDRVLPGCGICYPGGYDINTVGNVQGILTEMLEPDDGPVRLIVAGEHERWVVLASPGWFWKIAGQRLFPGDAVVVRGSKTLGAEGTLYLVAQEIRPAGSASVVVLRDPRGTPLWSARHRGGREPSGEGGACRGPAARHSRNGGSFQ